MAIEFNCPKCNSVIGFADKHAGKRAHCTTCGQSFFIPDKSYGKVKIIKPPKEKSEDPIPGFYHAALIDNWKTFLNPKSVTGIVFIMITAIFYFFTANRNCIMNITTRGGGVITIFLPFGWAGTGISWGFLFWYYREIIYSSAYEEENLPEVILGGFYSVIGKIASSVYTLFVIFLAVGLPALVIYLIFEEILLENKVLLYLLILFGLFLLPAAVMNMAIGKDFTLLRPDYLIRQAIRDFKAYFVIYLLLSAAIFLQIFSKRYNPYELSMVGIYFILNIITQFVFIFAVRAIGLFYYHYSCHTPW